ncbi:hypothetical protein SAMN03159338_2600 [Sphingomonas sp. NFR04]|uniref:hypothetical protein n=1 Tax=Sphingomonas sp. NFR04 TaxID=1566283 RepID=UPI0008E4953A|nr:hypothetical protein [Sphingomonas sp. NFR04]SFJ86556.1 hypothetical protein SAMN03159338_2600 [Sphingomonas sp. NFR04]
MRVLFYLPVVTPWWFEHVIEPLIRRVSEAAEVHVLAPVPWCNTGLGPKDLQRAADLANVHWAIVDGADHPSLRTVPSDPQGLIDYVHGLAPDLTLCRSADFETPRHFPGQVRYIMEAVTSPFQPVSPANTVHFTEEPFVNGAMPVLSDGDAARLDALIAPFWPDMEAHWQAAAHDHESVYRAIGIPGDRPVVVLPLEYEHAENFFLQHRPGGLSNQALVAQAAAAAEKAGVTLVITDHPLNTLHVDRDALYDAIFDLGGPILADQPVFGVSATSALLRHGAGVLLNDSKSFAVAAALGVPMFRQSRFASAAWLHAETDLPAYLAAVRAGTAQRPEMAAVRRWFAYHNANEAFYPTDPQLTGAMVIERALNPVDPARWDAGIARLQRYAALERAA